MKFLIKFFLFIIVVACLTSWILNHMLAQAAQVTSL